MFNKIKGLLAGLALVAVSATASAATWTHTKDWNPDVKIPPAQTWTHDLTTVGFTPLVDVITEFTLSVYLYDDKKKDGIFDEILPEIALITLTPPFGGSTQTTNWGWTNVEGDSFLGFLEINLLGQLTVTLSSIVGDFYLDKAVLTATGTSGNQVPEPGALALLGLGLAGLAVARRRQQKA